MQAGMRRDLLLLLLLLHDSRRAWYLQPTAALCAVCRSICTDADVRLGMGEKHETPKQKNRHGWTWTDPTAGSSLHPSCAPSSRVHWPNPWSLPSFPGLASTGSQSGMGQRAPPGSPPAPGPVGGRPSAGFSPAPRPEAAGVWSST